MDVLIRATLPTALRASVERLLFFNQRQAERRAGIVSSVERYGRPRLTHAPDGLSVTLGDRDDAQCLFAAVRRRHQVVVAGVLVWVREPGGGIVIVHVALSRVFSRSRRSLLVPLKLVRAVRAVARQLRGVESIRVAYTDRFYRVRSVESRAVDSFACLAS